MKLYIVGRVLKSFGVRGFVKVDPLTHSIERFKKLRKVYVGTDEKSAEKLTVEQVDITKKGIMVKFHAVSDKTTSDKLSGSLVFVDEGEVIPPPTGSYFIHDIIGCTVWLNGNAVGTVVEVYSRTQGLAQDIWIIEKVDGKKIRRYWLPAVPEFIQEVQRDQRRILIRGITDLVEE